MSDQPQDIAGELTDEQRAQLEQLGGPDALAELERLAGSDVEIRPWHGGKDGSAASKIVDTLRELADPGEDAAELELTIASVALGIERGLRTELEKQQATGQLDEFVYTLARFLAWHRSDNARRLVVVELPRVPDGRLIPAGTRLHLLDEAIAAAGERGNPLG